MIASREHLSTGREKLSWAEPRVFRESLPLAERIPGVCLGVSRQSRESPRIVLLAERVHFAYILPLHFAQQNVKAKCEGTMIFIKQEKPL